MSDVTANIQLITTGGDDSAAEIQKATTAINTLTSSSSNLQTKFQERFQHIGLQLFAGQALQSIGLSGETRQAVMLMNTSLTAAEGAAGVASGGLTLLLTALVAVGAAVYEVTSKHKDLVESLEKVVQTQQDALSSTQDNISILDSYRNAVGSLTPAQQALYGAEYNLAQLQKGDLLDSIQRQIAAVQAEMAANTAHAHTLALLTQIWGELKAVMADALQELVAWIPGAETLEKAFQLEGNLLKSVVSGFKEHASATSLSAQQTKALTEANEPLLVKLKELDLELQTGGAKWQDYYKKATDSANEAKQKMEQDQNDYWQKFDQGVQQELKDWQKLKADELKDQEAQVKEMKKSQDDLEKSVKDHADAMAKDFSSMANSMIFDGQNIGQALTQEWQHMAEQFIDYVVKMIVEWAALKAIMMIYPGGAGAFEGLAQASYPAVAQGAMQGITSHAIGGSQFADTPTLAMFGEAGPEMATFTPLSGSGSGGMGGGGGDTYNINLTMNANGVNDPQQLARQVGLYLAQNIRGGGQISLSRS